MARRGSSKKTETPTFDGSTRVLVLHGPDEMRKKQHLDALMAVLETAHGEVERFGYDGKSAQLSDVFDELRGYSLMQQYKVVVVDDADQFVKTHRAAIERYAENPVDHATLVLRAGTWHRGNLDKKIVKVGAVVKCEPPSAAEAVAWLVDRAAAEHQSKLDRATAQMLVERLGLDLMGLDSEVAKLSLMTDPGKPITSELVEQVVGRSSDEQAWVVQEAILSGFVAGRPEQMLGKIHELVDLSGQPDVLVTYFVADLMRKFAVAISLKRGGMPEGQIGKALKLWGPRQQLFMQALRQMRPGMVGGLFDRILEMDARSKSGLGKSLRNLECFCVAMADN